MKVDHALIAKKPWLGAAVSQLGVKEYEGLASNPQIEAYHKVTGLGSSDDAVPWCSSFLNWCFITNGLAGTNSPASRSWTQWGQAVPLKELSQGDVVVFRLADDPDSWRGHVGLYMGDEGLPYEKVYILSGNMSDSVNISEWSRADIIAIRRPKTRKDSTTIRASAGAGVCGAGILGTTATINAVASTAEQVTNKAQNMGTNVLLVVLGLGLAAALWWIYKERVERLKESGV